MPCPGGGQGLEEPLESRNDVVLNLQDIPRRSKVPVKLLTKVNVPWLFHPEHHEHEDFKRFIWCVSLVALCIAFNVLFVSHVVNDLPAKKEGLENELPESQFVVYRQ